ncbi:MAG TPA: TAXI family TRAP transporter solute-binding subunit [Desulfobacterales bacterium]|nr:TAXI family TRAP transporter solute-binding subunit [Desulfobacterales bacterium]
MGFWADGRQDRNHALGQLRPAKSGFLSIRTLLLAVVLVGATLWVSIQFPIPAPPRRIVLASGPEFGLYHQHALRYRELLARNGIEVELKRSSGAGENIELLLDPASGVEVAFVQGGLKQPPRTDGLVMLISLFYEPLWIFHRVSDAPTEIREFKGRRISNGGPGTGTHASTEPLLVANGLDVGSTPRVPLNGPEALAALRRGDVDVMFYVGGVDTPFVRDALNDPALKLMSLPRAEAYAHRWPHISRLTLSEGTIDLERNVPQQQVSLIGTKAMLAARDGLHPAIINLLVDAAREIHAEQDEFKAAGEFPNTAPIDLRVSLHADNYRRYGASAVYNYLPFRVAAFLERAIILLVPMLVVLPPLLSYIPKFIRWRMRSRIYRWYGELALIERDVGSRQDLPPIDQWLRDLDRIEHAVEGVRTPACYASEAYTLRDHIDLVRRAVLARANVANISPGSAESS